MSEKEREYLRNTHRMLYNNSFSINGAKGYYKGESMKNVDVENDNNHQIKKVLPSHVWGYIQLWIPDILNTLI